MGGSRSNRHIDVLCGVSHRLIISVSCGMLHRFPVNMSLSVLDWFILCFSCEVLVLGFWLVMSWSFIVVLFNWNWLWSVSDGINMVVYFMMLLFMVVNRLWHVRERSICNMMMVNKMMIVFVVVIMCSNIKMVVLIEMIMVMHIYVMMIIDYPHVVVSFRHPRMLWFIIHMMIPLLVMLPLHVPIERLMFLLVHLFLIR